MKTTIVEVTNGPNNWGKFLIGRLDDEWQRHSAVETDCLLLASIGYGVAPDHSLYLVLDLQTREGALFYLRGQAHPDLQKHKVWVCPMFEPFLEWLYTRYREDGGHEFLENLPAHVDLPDAPFAMRGYRRPGPVENPS